MEEIKKDVKLIRESQIRMEQDVKHHIQRTDLLEERLETVEKDIKPLYIFHFFKVNLRFIVFLCSSIGAAIYFYLRAKGL